AREYFAIDDDLCASVWELHHSEGVSVDILLLAVFDALLARYSGQDTIVVERSLGNLQTVLQMDVSNHPTFRALLRHVRDVAAGAFDDGSELVVFRVRHELLNYAMMRGESVDRRSITDEPGLSFRFSLSHAALEGCCEYDPSIFDEMMVAAFARQ